MLSVWTSLLIAPGRNLASSIGLGGADPAASEDEIRHVLAPVLPERAYTRVLRLKAAGARAGVGPSPKGAKMDSGFPKTAIALARCRVSGKVDFASMMIATQHIVI